MGQLLPDSGQTCPIRSRWLGNACKTMANTIPKSTKFGHLGVSQRHISKVDQSWLKFRKFGDHRRSSPTGPKKGQQSWETSGHLRSLANIANIAPTRSQDAHGVSASIVPEPADTLSDNAVVVRWHKGQAQEGRARRYLSGVRPALGGGLWLRSVLVQLQIAN